MRIEILTYLNSATLGKPSNESDRFNIAPFISTNFPTALIADIKTTLTQMVSDGVINISGNFSSFGVIFGGVPVGLANTTIHAQLTDKGALEVTPTGTITKTLRAALLTYMNGSPSLTLNIAPYLAANYQTVSTNNIRATLAQMNSDGVAKIAGDFMNLGVVSGGVTKITSNIVIHGQVTAKGIKEIGG